MNTEPNTHKKTLVFVDDDNLSNILMERFVKDMPFHAYTFSDTDVAMEFIKSNDVCALFVDLRMPLVDGVTFVKSLVLSKNPPTIKHIILLSAALPEESTIEAIKALGVELILKDSLFKDESYLLSLIKD